MAAVEPGGRWQPHRRADNRRYLAGGAVVAGRVLGGMAAVTVVAVAVVVDVAVRLAWVVGGIP